MLKILWTVTTLLTNNTSPRGLKSPEHATKPGRFESPALRMPSPRL